MTSAHDVFTTQLKQSGYSLTAPRRLAFTTLLERDKLSMHELIIACPQIDRATVYRTVQLLENIGIIHKVYAGWKYTLELGDAFRDHHHHALCTVCRAYIDLPEDTELEKLITRLASRKDFTLNQHSLELSGVCAPCSRKRKIKES